MDEVLDRRVGAGKEETLVSVVLPTHAVRRSTGIAAHLEDLPVSIGLTAVVSLDDDAVSCGHVHSGSSRSSRAPTPMSIPAALVS